VWGALPSRIYWTQENISGTEFPEKPALSEKNLEPLPQPQIWGIGLQDMPYPDFHMLAPTEFP
jgi:hypothetical protein